MSTTNINISLNFEQIIKIISQLSTKEKVKLHQFLEEDAVLKDEIPEWHKTIVRERMEDYKKHPENVMDFDTAMDEIEKEFALV